MSQPHHEGPPRRPGGKPHPGGGRRRADAGTGERPLFIPRPQRGPGPGPLPVLRLKVEKRSRHPWIYLKMCERPGPHGPQDGDAVAIYDRRHRFVGRGLFNGRSQIGARVLDPGGEGEALDQAFFEARFAEALRIRREVLGLDRRTDAYRLINTEGDALSGLIIDVYAAHASCELLSLGLWKRREQIEAALRSHLPQLDTVTFRADERIQQVEGFRVPRHPARVEATVQEDGVRFAVDVTSGHKTGFFCDQRENRALVARLAAGRRMLDLCCYTGGFSLHAAARGAADVTGVDLDEKAIALARTNARLNADVLPNAAALRFVHANAFGFLKESIARGERWDVVVLDPPKLVRTRNDLQKGLRDYFDLNRHALRVVRPGGLLLTCSCSGLVSAERFTDTVSQAAFEADRRVRVLQTLGPGGDHPTDPACPENVYLKVLLTEVR